MGMSVPFCIMGEVSGECHLFLSLAPDPTFASRYELDRLI